MYRATVRFSPRAIRTVRQTPFPSLSRRHVATASGPRKGTWKGTFARWGVAIGAVYWYNTSPIFADEADPLTVPPPPQFAESDLPTVNAVVEEKRKLAEKAAQKTAAPPTPTEEAQTTAAPESGHAGSPEELEEEAGRQGAFDPETGEINWDCPCLGGMADGPCGEEFKAAFSCFVYSTEEPKGMDCIDKFQHMQDCFRKYPEVYGAELAEEEDEDAPAPVDGAAAPGDGEETATQDQEPTPEVSQKETHQSVAAASETSSAAAQPSSEKKKEDDASKLESKTPAVAEQNEAK